jgi:hypothetical protein
MACLASFGGITRIRFKGFDRHFSPIISATRLPRTYFLVRIRRARRMSKVDRPFRRTILIHLASPTYFLTSSKGLLDPLPEFNVAQRRGYSGSTIISLLPLVLCWCERSGAIRHSSFARSIRRCRSLRRLCLPRWLPPSPGRSRVPCLHRS